MKSRGILSEPEALEAKATVMRFFEALNPDIGALEIVRVGGFLKKKAVSSIL